VGILAHSAPSAGGFFACWKPAGSGLAADVKYGADVDEVRPSAAEQARTIAASSNTATLATLTATGDPWASFVTYGLLDGAPVLCVSNLAEHGRNLAADHRASIAIVAPHPDPSASARVTLAGAVERPSRGDAGAARDAHLAAVPAARLYIDFSDFAIWVLRIERVRWYGGYGRAESVPAAAYAAAEPDPVAPCAARAVAHLNADHADALCAMASTIGGHPDATSATCTGADRYGLDLEVSMANGTAHTRVSYAAPINSCDDLRSATAELVRRATIGS
jgi:heme oxygenase (biliverdin-IX-beta and delta-forming)